METFNNLVNVLTDATLKDVLNVVFEVVVTLVGSVSSFGIVTYIRKVFNEEYLDKLRRASYFAEEVIKALDIYEDVKDALLSNNKDKLAHYSRLVYNEVVEKSSDDLKNGLNLLTYLPHKELGSLRPLEVLLDAVENIELSSGLVENQEGRD